jgi:hypothetical protein
VEVGGVSLPDLTIIATNGSAIAYLDPHAFEVRVERGRSRELDPPSAGIAEFYLRNNDGLFNPGNTGGTISAGTVTVSPPATLLAPGTRVAINCENGNIVDSSLFYGRIRSAEYSYDVSGDAVVRVVAEDALAGLARRTLVGFSHGIVSYGSAIRATLDNVDYVNQVSTWGTSIFPFPDPVIGKSVTTIAPYGTAESAGVNALDYLAAIEASEQGRIFCERRGFMVAYGRYDSGQSSAITFTDNPGSTATYPVRYQTISGRSGGDVLYTRVLGYSPTTDSWREATAAGTATYGLTSDLSMSNLRNARDSEVDGVIGLLADTYDTPEWRVQELSCKPFATVAAGTALEILLNVELADGVRVEFTPAGGSAVSDVYIVQGVRHTITPGDHTMSLTLSVKQWNKDDLFTLGTSTLGTAGTDVLAY